MSYKFVTSAHLNFINSSGVIKSCYPVTGSGSCGDKSVGAKLNAGGYTYIAWPINDDGPPNSTGINIIKNGVHYIVPDTQCSRVCPSASVSTSVDVTSKDAYGQPTAWATKNYIDYSVTMDPAPTSNKTFTVHITWNKSSSKNVVVTILAGSNSASSSFYVDTWSGNGTVGVSITGATIDDKGGWRWV